MGFFEGEWENAIIQAARQKKSWELKKFNPNFSPAKSLEFNQVMASFGLRRLYVSSQNWLQPATRFSVSRTRHASTQWRAAASQKAKYSTVEDYGDPTLVPTPSEKLDPAPDAGGNGTTDWSKSYFGLSSQPFAKEIADVLMSPLHSDDVEIKPGKHF